jgi:transcriptional regulator GlxA family with amidase domain
MLLNELPQNIPIPAMALAAGKSVRQLERLFKDRIGVSPNFFRKLRRFATAYKIKELNPNQTWTQIAYSCGYFDQMHLIKDFKTFLGHNPSYINQMLNQQYQEYTNYQIPQ